MTQVRAFLNTLPNALSLGKPNWSGDGNVFSLQYGYSILGQAIIDRGIMQVEDATALSLIGGVDTQFACIPGRGWYSFNPSNAINPPAGSITSNGGGRWELLISFVPVVGTVYSQQIGDGVNTEFEVVHNLGTQQPTVIIIETKYGLPAQALNPTNYDWKVLNDGKVEIILATAAASNQYTVTIKK